MNQKTITVLGISHIRCTKHAKKCHATRLYLDSAVLPYLDVETLIGVKVGDKIEITKTHKEIKIHQIKVLKAHYTGTPDTRGAILKNRRLTCQ